MSLEMMPTSSSKTTRMSSSPAATGDDDANVEALAGWAPGASALVVDVVALMGSQVNVSTGTKPLFLLLGPGSAKSIQICRCANTKPRSVLCWLALYGHGCAIIGGHSTTGNGSCAITSCALCLRIAMATVALRFDAAGGMNADETGSPLLGGVGLVLELVIGPELELGAE